MFDAIRASSVTGLGEYLREPPHYLIFIAAGIQAWQLGRQPNLRWPYRSLGNLIAPTLYTLVDMILEGPGEFWAAPNHIVYWVFAIGMAIVYALEGIAPARKTWFILSANLWRVLLFPVLYAVSELSTELPTISSLRIYWLENSGHRFIFWAAIFFGLLLGARDVQLDRYLAVLRRVALQLKQVSEWSLAPDLLAKSLQDASTLQQRRVERAVLFMDVRGFTQWSENKPPELVVGMLNQFYEEAESIVMQYGGHKPHFTADELLTWFEQPQQAIDTAVHLNQQIHRLLHPYQLSVGIGLHWGSVVEGLMGSSSTRNYNIIGDTVNTASRLVSAAKPGEVVVSSTLAQQLKPAPQWVEKRQITAKGKQDPLEVLLLPTKKAGG
ncbi:MAG: adenylate/guanylate cyclase domain-containing protein [Chloroflexota bacterium]